MLVERESGIGSENHKLLRRDSRRNPTPSDKVNEAQRDFRSVSQMLILVSVSLLKNEENKDKVVS